MNCCLVLFTCLCVCLFLKSDLVLCSVLLLQRFRGWPCAYYFYSVNCFIQCFFKVRSLSLSSIGVVGSCNYCG